MVASSSSPAQPGPSPERQPGRSEKGVNLGRWFRETSPVTAIRRRLQAGSRSLLVDGTTGNASALLATALAHDRPVVLIAGSQESGERAADAIGTYAGAGSSWFLMGHSSAFLEEGSSLSSTRTAADRLTALDALSSGRRCLVIATVAGLLQYTYAPADLRRIALDLQPGGPLNLDETLRHLVEIGYERAEVVQQPGEFAARGGILDVYPADGSSPARIDLFGDDIESIRTFDAASQRSTGVLKALRILPACEPVNDTDCTLLDYLPGDTLLLVDDASALHGRWEEFEGEVQDQIRALVAGLDQDADAPAAVFPFRRLPAATGDLERFPTIFLNHLSHHVPWGHPELALSLTCEPIPHMDGDMPALASRLHAWHDRGVTTCLFSHQWPRLTELLSAQGIAVARSLPVPLPSSLPAPDSGSAPASFASTEAVVSEIALEGAAAETAQAQSAEARDTSGEAARRGLTLVAPGTLSEGFFIPSARLAVLSDAEIFAGVKLRRPARRFKDSSPLTSLLDLKPGDMVVHIDHGIGHFRGLKSMEVEGVRRDYLHVEYAQGDKLFVPADQINRVQRYIGAEDHAPPVHRLGGTDWTRTKRRVREAVEILAKDLIALYAARSQREGHAFGPDSAWEQEMESAFVYEETPDQLRAIRDIKEDLESDKPMDRLVCGDVGYGKTEVAIRAAFKVVMNGKQVAILVPTTVLAQQHFNTFTERLSGFPVKIETLSRFRTRREQAAVVEGLKDGSVDIVIGTHRLLSKDVGFKDLGLVVVDEEQRFGVTHKEKLKQLRQMVDVLTLTATPIPRTLHMAISTIRDMSVMNQAPEGRTAIRTYLREYSDDLVRQCILRELERDGQVYFVHNRVESLPHVAETLRKLVPQARVGMAHGQMPEQLLEQVMLDFYEREYDVLCCTTIIESGLDIPNVNTICIDNADRLGLAQLYQLRGRVGRSNRQAYCFLLFKPDRELSELAQKRLQALREFSDLGSGFRIAMRDLEIRGAGNLLGAEQSGALSTVGFDLYCQMIADAVRTLRNDPPPPPPLPPVDLPIAAYLPADYIPAESLRVEFYKRLSSPTTAEEIVAIQEEMQDRFGQMPVAVRNLLAILRLRLQCRRAGVVSITPEKEQVVVRFGPRLRLSPATIASLQARHRGARFLTDRALVPRGARGTLGPVGEVMDSLLAVRRSMARRAAGGG